MELYTLKQMGKGLRKLSISPMSYSKLLVIRRKKSEKVCGND